VQAHAQTHARARAHTQKHTHVTAHSHMHASTRADVDALRHSCARRHKGAYKRTRADRYPHHTHPPTMHSAHAHRVQKAPSRSRCCGSEWFCFRLLRAALWVGRRSVQAMADSSRHDSTPCLAWRGQHAAKGVRHGWQRMRRSRCVGLRRPRRPLRRRGARHSRWLPRGYPVGTGWLPL